ncbi:MAG: DUF3343 domain-containing protein [Butyricicoccus sp.]
MRRNKQLAAVIAFDATVQAMAAEQYCLEHGLPGRLIPVPREITAGCGLAWKTDPTQQDAIPAALTRAGILWSSVHLLEI